MQITVWGMPIVGAPRNLSFYDINESNNDVTLIWDQVQHAATAKVEQYTVETCVTGCDMASGWSRVADVSTDGLSGSDRVRYTHEGGASELLRRYRVKAFNGIHWPASEELAIATQTTGASIISTPACDNTYRLGDHIDIAVDFSRAVTKVGAPKLALAIGNDAASRVEQFASYNSGSGTTRIVFRYTVLANIVDTNGLQLHNNPVRVDTRNKFVPTAAPDLSVGLKLGNWQDLSPTQYVDVRNSAPAFPYDDRTMDIPETLADSVENTARNISLPIIATDADCIDTLTYSLEGADAASFEIDADTAQLKTKAGEQYDFEAKAGYSVTLRVNDGSGGTDTASLNINITDVDEPPLAPDRPSVSPAFGTTHSLDVSWTDPGNAGRPEIDHYDVQYRKGASGDWTDGPQDVRGTSATITRLTPDSDHQAQVRAVNDEGDGEWSEPGSGRTWPPQRSATGAPDISGGWQVGRLLTASKGDIADDNGVPPESEFTWQWLRLDGSSEVEISDATGKTYTLTAADAGKWVKVKATFRDGLGNEERRTSLPYPAYGSVLSATCGRPSLGSRREIWSGTITAGAIASDIMNGQFEHGYSQGRAGRLLDTDFMLGPNHREIVLLSTQLVDGGSPPIDLRMQLDRALTATQKAALTLHICDDEAIALSSSSLASLLVSFRFRGFGSLWFDGLERDVRLSLPANTPATGSPAIAGGPPDVGQTLTASKGDIADADGVPGERAFKWQWLRVDGATESEIIGATGRTYTSTGADFSKHIKVKAVFTDGLGSEEIRTSAATALVISTLPLITIAPGISPVIEGTDATFTLSRTGATATALAVDVDVSEAGGDMVASAGEGAKTVSFEMGRSTATLSVQTVDDQRDEEHSAVTAAILADAGDADTYWPGVPESATVTVNDDEDDSTNVLTIRRLGADPSDPCVGFHQRPSERVEGLICLGVWYPTNDEADTDGFTESDVELEKGTVANFSYPGSRRGLQRITVNITGSGGEEFVFRIPRGALDAGNLEAVFRATITGNALPTGSDNTVTAEEDTSYTFRASAFGYADEDSDALASVKITALPATGTLALDGTAVTPDQVLAAPALGTLTYAPPADANGPGYASFSFTVSDGTSESASPYLMTVDVTAVNDAATGAPTISGTVRVGQVLTADVSGIADVDRLPNVSTFGYQWLRVDSGSATDIADATADTYRLAPADAGKKLKVRVEFTDLDGTAESRTSAAYPASQSVGQNTAPTGSDNTVTVAEDGVHTFAASAFGYADEDSDALASVKITALPATGTLALDGTAVTPDQVLAAPALGTLTYAPPADANGPGYASFSFTVSDGTSESASPYLMTVDVTAVNDAATGAPTISGTVRVGQVLTADVSGIADVDRLPNVSTFGYQWLRVDSGSATDIADATADTYRLAPADAGKKLKVRVEFTDLDGTAESRTSAAYPASQSVGQNTAPTGADNTVTVAEDGVHTFAASAFGYADEDSDALASVKITALPATGTLALDGTAVTPDQVLAAPALGTLTYAPPADANGPGYASFSFTVSDGTSESASPYLMTVDVTAVNDAATGAPTISGTVRVGQVLTADVSGIADVDRLPNVSTFGYQWLRVDSGSATDIADATADTYRLAPADAGKKLKVRVEFTDLDGTAESRTSAAYPASQSVGQNTAPTGSDNTVTVAEDGVHTFAASAFGYADEDSDALASVKITALPATGTLALDGTAVTPDQVLAAPALGTLTYAPPADANGPGYASFSFTVSDGTSESASPYLMTVDVTAVNDAATGAPTISGTVRVGQVLTADVSGIADVDRLPNVSTFGYQWLRVDSGSATDIADATADTYRLAPADAGKKLKVRVEFTDLDGTAESRTSAAYPASQSVGQNTAPTGSDNTVTVAEDGVHTFAASAFGYADEDSDALASVKITALPATGTLALDGTAVTPDQVLAAPALGTLTYAPPADANGPGYASFSFTVSDGTSESASPYLMTVDVTAVNDAATGAPTISGTVRVGQVLTADVSGIADVDRLPNVSTFGYQWLRVDSGSATDIADATADTYRLAPADAGKKLKVRVEFTDLDGTAESRTSAAYPASQSVGQNTAPTGADNTVTVAEDGVHTFAASAFGYADEDSDALASVKITALPATGTLALDGTAVTPDQVLAAPALGTLTYAPPADANGPGYASFSFTVSDGTSESASPYLMTVDVTAVNDAATGAPTISGTVRVGQVLTADVSGIADVDRLPNVSTFGYQWLRVDSGSATDIADATADTYRLAPADAGKKLKVRVEFTDLDGTAESRTSAAYPASQSVGQNTAPTGADNTVTVAEDGVHTFAASAFGYADEDSDALASVKITALPATGTLALDGTAVTPDQVLAAPALGTLTYAPPADANGPGYASFSFTVSDGTSESASPYLMTVDVTAVNDAATGAPTISGTVRVGQVLTADVSGIADVDRLPNVSTFGYQWLRVDSGSATDIADATADTYRLAPADAGKKLKVRVEFTDLDGTAESRTSAAYPASQSVGQNTAPTGADNTVTVAEDGVHTFAASAFGYADEDSDALASVKITALPATGTLALDGTAVTPDQVLAAPALGTLTYAPPADANGPGYASFSFTVSDGTSESASPYLMTVDVTAVNDAATGAPTISGTVRVGQVLTADVSGIADVDRLPNVSTFGYQWLRVDSGSATDIADATADTYRLAPADAGKKLKVRVEFTDLDGTAESRTSAAYPASQSVGQNTAPTGADNTVTVAEDGVHTFAASAFGYADEDSDALASVKITALPATGTLALDGTAVTPDQVLAAPALGTLTYAPPADANGPGYASFSFTVSDGTSESASPYLMTVDVTAVNDAATGAPTISGTVRVGQVLTADVSGIADVDRLPNVSTFGYQWLRVDSGSATDIADATADTYRLAPADAGKKLKVRVEFTDLDGTAESRTSAAYPASQSVGQNTAPTGADNTVTVAEDGVHTFAASAFGYADEDGDALASVKITALPATGTLALDGTAVTPDQVLAAPALGTLTYAPPADANGPGYASFSFTVSDGTSESASPYLMTVDVTAVNDAATGAPTISGTVRVGQVLTADVSGIADVDRLPNVSTFGYQWLRVDSGSATDIADATADTYRLAPADAGKKLKVRVEFTDLDGTAESRTSAAYPASQSVGQNTAPTGGGQHGDGGGGRCPHLRGVGVRVCGRGR